MLTKYGSLTGIYYLGQYPEGGIKECIVTEYNELDTPYGKLVPHYLDDEVRRKHIKPISFYENGNLKNISLQEPVKIETSVGTFPAEYLSFYEDGSIRRIFPLDGKLSGYWDEEDEYALAREFEFNFSFGGFKQKVISLNFYENGDVKSLTFWPKDNVVIETPVGTAQVRIGISLYPGGKLKSFEPGRPTLVDTPIGKIMAYDSSAVGIHGDANSLGFSREGDIEHVVTTTNEIVITDKNGKVHSYKPGLEPSMIDPEVLEPVPLSIQFSGNKVRFNNNIDHEYDISECSFIINTMLPMAGGKCSACSNCSACNTGCH